MINIIHDIMMPFLFLFSTGLRISEFCGRTVKDLDFEEKVINVDHQLQRSHNMKYYIESTKTTSGTRKIPMTEEVKELCQRIVADRISQGEKQSLMVMVDFFSLIRKENQWWHFIGRSTFSMPETSTIVSMHYSFHRLLRIYVDIPFALIWHVRE